MAHQQPPTKGGLDTVLVIAGLIVGVVVIVCITAVAIAVEDGARATSMIALIAAPLTLLLGFFGLFVGVRNIGSKLNTVAGQTTALTNGLGAAQARSAVAEVLPDHLIDPAYVATGQAQRDRARRATAAEAAAALVTPHVFPEDEGL